MSLNRAVGLVVASLLLGAGCGGDDDGDSGDSSAADAAAVVDSAVVVDAAPSSDSAPSADSMPLACGTTGSATVTGEVAGVSLSPVARAFLLPLDAGGYIVAISTDEAADVCAESDSGNAVAIIACGDAAVGSYPVGTPDTFDCPGGAGSVVEDATGGDLANSTDGTFEIASVSSDCVTGSFDITYGGDGSFSGSFAAVVCPPL